MAEEPRTDGASTPPTPEPPAPEPAPAPAPGSGPAPAPGEPAAPVPPAQPQPNPYAQPQPYAPQPYNPPAYQPAPGPAPLMQLTGGMKFGWFVVGALMGIPGMIIAWLVNVDKMPQVKSDAIKWAVIGFVVWIVLGLIIGFFVGMAFTALIAGAVGSIDPSSYGYGHYDMW